MARSELAGAMAAAAALGACASVAPTPEPVQPAGPLPVSQADICAIAARPEQPGMDQSEYQEALWARKDRILEAARWQSVPWRYDRRRRVLHGPWGECPGWGVNSSTLSFSADGRYAVAYGGWQAAEHAGGRGHCLYEKEGESWELIACDVTDVS